MKQRLISMNPRQWLSGKLPVQIFITTILTLFSIVSHADTIRAISTADNLSNNAVYSIWQDSKNHLWIGTADGLNVWNGHSIERIEAADGDRYFTGNTIRSIMQADKDHIWLRTDNGIARMNTVTRQVYFHDNLKFTVDMLVLTDGSTFVLGKDMHLYEYAQATSSFVKSSEPVLPSDKKGYSYISLVSDSLISGGIAFTSHGIFRIEYNTKESHCKTAQISDTSVKCVSKISLNDKYYLITDDYILMAFNLETSNLTTIANLKEDIPALESVKSILPVKEGLNIGFDSGGVSFISFEDILSGQCNLRPTPVKTGIFVMVHDALQPIIWVGTDGSGLVRWHKSMFDFTNITYEQLPYSIDMPARSILVDKKGNLWFGTKGNGLVVINNFEYGGYYDKTNTDIFTIANSNLLNNRVYVLKESNHDFFWIGSDGPGLNYFSYSEKKIKTVKGSSGIKKVHSIIEENDSTLWVATDGEGTYKCRFKTITGRHSEPIIYKKDTIRFPAPFNDRDRIFAMIKENDSTMWFGSRGSGALKYNILTKKGEVFQFKSNEGYASNVISCIAKTNKTLFATGNGCAIYDQKNGNSYISDYAKGKAIHGILNDSNNCIWLSTNSGIIYMNEPQGKSMQFNRNYGLKILEFSDGAYYRDIRTKTLYFGGINGIVAIRENPVYLDLEPYIPDINITDFVRDNNRSDIAGIMKKGRLSLPYSKSPFSISFSVVDNINYSDYVFSYNLSGLNETWVDNGNNNSITMSQALPPGDYNLKIRYFNKATSLAGKEYSLPIHVSPPIYASWPAKLLYTTLILALIIFLLKYITRKYNLMKENLRKQYLAEARKTRSETISNITDELSVLVTFILGTCQQLRQISQKDPYISEKVDLIKYNVARINRIMYIFNEYKNLNDINTESVALVPIGQMAEEIVRLMKNTRPKSLSLETEIEKNLVWTINKDRWITMFNILLSTAIKYTIGEEKIVISIHKYGRFLHLTIKFSSNLKSFSDLSLIINDQSFQMSKLTDENINNNQEISLSKKLIEDIEGVITCNWNADVHEIAFDVTLPEQASAVEDKSQNLISTENQEQNNIISIASKNRIDARHNNILLVSNNDEICFFMNEFLTGQYKFKAITDNESVLTYLKANTPSAIIYDVFTNSVNEFSFFLNAFKEEKISRRVQIIALTSALQYNERLECTRLGADLCISFPFDIKYVLESLERLLNKKQDIAEYYSSPISSYVVENNRVIHVDDKIFIDSILKIIDKNISKPDLSPAFIADKMNVSLRAMYRKLENITEIKPQQIINDMRMKLAANLLSSSKCTVDEIMYKCGYNNKSTFYKNFKKNYNYTPNQYRDMLKKNIMNQ